MPCFAKFSFSLQTEILSTQASDFLKQIVFLKPFNSVLYMCLSYDIAVIQWITSCHKNHMITHVKTRWCIQVTSLTTSMSAVHFLNEVIFILKVIKCHFKGSYDNRILHSWSFPINFMKRALSSFHKFHMK